MTKVANLTIAVLANRDNQLFLDCLRSAQFAQYVLVLDNNSGVDFSELKKKYDLIVKYHPDEIKDFATIKNQLMKDVKTVWVLYLDSDEILPNTAKDEIEKIIENDFYDALTINRVDYFHGKALNYGETKNHAPIRLFKKELCKFSRPVHEYVECTGRIGRANFSISHFSHENIASFLQRVTNWAKMEANYRLRLFADKDKNPDIEYFVIIKNKLEMIFFPIGKFLLNYIFKLGLLDGYRGFVYALMMSLHSFFVRVFFAEQLTDVKNNDK
jgi:hypothetical protein